MPDWILGVLGFVVATAIIIFIVQRIRKSNWKGYLHKKKFNAGDMDSTPTYNLVFKTDDGKTKRVQVNEREFNEWEEGDRAEKVEGEFKPKRVE